MSYAKDWSEVEQEIQNLWRVRSKIVSTGNTQVGESQLYQIRVLQEQYNISNLSLLTELLLQEIPKGKTSEIIKDPRYKMAKDLSPDSALPYRHLCYFSLDIDQWKLAMKACLQGLQIAMNHPWSKLHNWVLLSQAAFYACLFCVILIFLMFILKYGDFIVQYYSSSFKALSPLNFTVLVSLMFVIVFCITGYAGLVISFTPFLWRFTSKGEKNLLLVMTVGFSLLIPLLFTSLSIEKRSSQEIVSVFENIRQGFQINKNKQILEHWIKENPSDAQAHFLLGSLEKSVGNKALARIHLEQAGTLAPDWDAPWINLANLEFLQQPISQTAENYGRILSRFPRSSIAYLNASTLETRLGNSSKSQELRNRARSIRPHTYDRLQSQVMQSENILDASIDVQDYQDQIWTWDNKAQHAFTSIFRNYFTFFSLKSYLITLSLIMLLCVFFRNFISLQPLFLVYREKLSLLKASASSSKTLVAQRRGLLKHIHKPVQRLFYIASPGVYFFVNGNTAKSFWSIFSIMFFICGSYVFYQDHLSRGSFPLFIFFILAALMSYAAHLHLLSKVSVGKS
ncbi:MAG: hypothetical protein KDD52_05025 [Bdellovibrionales bacterium]|nr:hypothetical protein [Bdellovibrionales bacterium]